MNTEERNELVMIFAQNYIYEKQKQRIWQRENASSYTYAKGRLNATCTLLGLEYEEKDTELVVFTRVRKKVIARVEIPDLR